MNSDSRASKISFRIGHELEVIAELDGAGHCLGGVCKVLWDSREDRLRENSKGEMTFEPDLKG